MTQNKYKIPLKFAPYASSCLAWGISHEIMNGDHTFVGLRELVLNGDFNDVRRYAEVVYHKTKNDEALFKTLIDSLNERCSFGKNSVEDFVNELRDWGFSYSRTKKRVSQDIKVLGEK